MKKVEFLEKEYQKFFEHVEMVDPTEKKQVVTFLKWCFEHDFLNNLSEMDLEYFYEDDQNLDLPILRNHHVVIGLESYAGVIHVGIDPDKAFNKTKQCSIIMEFPITSKREEQQFYKTLDILLDTKTPQSKYWFANAGHMWYGEFMTNSSA